jgi:rhomboid protease GluP
MIDHVPGVGAAAEVPTEEYKATWRSGLGFGVAAMAVFVVGGLLITAVSVGGGGGVVLGIFALLMAWLLWLLGRVLWSGKPVLRLGPEGLSGAAFKAGVLPWNEVADIREETVQGNTFLVVRRLMPPGVVAGKSWLGVRKDEVRVSLGPINAKLHPQVVEAAYRQFAARGGAQAAVAMQAQMAEQQAHAAFDERLSALTPRVWAMWVVMGLCAAVWVANVASGMSPLQPNAEQLYRWGANSASGVQGGEWWRLVTAMFLHGGILHLGLNMYALLEAGLMLTRLFGNRGFLVIYLGAGLVGNALSLHYAGQAGVSVGASGAVFGVAGALLAAVIRLRGKFPMGRSKQMLTSLGIFIFYSLAYGMKQGIDNAAHTGGLLAGFVGGWLLVAKLDETASITRRMASLAAVAALCVAATAALVIYTPPAQRDMGRYYADLKHWNALQTELGQAMSALRADSTQNKAGQLDESAMLRRLETVHAPELRHLASEFETLKLPQDEYVGRYAAAQLRFTTAMAGLMEAELQRQKTPTPELAEKSAKLSSDVAAASAAIEKLNAEQKAKKD